MPYVPNYNEEEEKDAANAPAGGGVAPQATAAMQAPGVAAPAGGAAALPGSRFVNFDKLMSANQSTVDRQTNEISGQAEKRGNAALGSLSATNTAFQQQKDAGRGATFQPIATPTTPVAAPKTTYNGNVATTKSAQLQAPAVAPSQGVSIAAARERAGQKYTGPDDLTGVSQYQQAMGDAASSDAYTNALKNTAGIQGLMSQDYGASRAGSVLDAALVGGAGASRFADARKRFGGMDALLKRDLASSIGEANDARRVTDEAAGAYGADVARYDKIAATNAGLAAGQQAAAAKRAQQQADMPKSAGKGNLQQTTVSSNDERTADQHGLGNEWRAAGSPPWDAWYAARKGK